jgi:hypothetical protein
MLWRICLHLLGTMANVLENMSALARNYGYVVENMSAVVRNYGSCCGEYVCSC